MKASFFCMFLFALYFNPCLVWQTHASLWLFGCMRKRLVVGYISLNKCDEDTQSVIKKSSISLKASVVGFTYIHWGLGQRRGKCLFLCLKQTTRCVIHLMSPLPADLFWLFKSVWRNEYRPRSILQVASTKVCPSQAKKKKTAADWSRKYQAYQMPARVYSLSWRGKLIYWERSLKMRTNFKYAGSNGRERLFRRLGKLRTTIGPCIYIFQ